MTDLFARIANTHTRDDVDKRVCQRFDSESPMNPAALFYLSGRGRPGRPLQGE